MFNKILLSGVLLVFASTVYAHIGKFTIQNMSSQQCMSAGTTIATPKLQQVACITKTSPKDPMQLWRFIEGTGQNSDYYYILSEGSAQCLQASLKGKVKLTTCDVKKNNQLFMLMGLDQIAGAGQAKKNIYRLLSIHSLQCLSLNTTTGVDTAQGLVTQVCDNGVSQQFMLNRMGTSNHHTSSSSSSSGDTSSSSSGNSSSSSGGSSSWSPPPSGGQKDQKISGVYITWYGFDDNSCETEAQHTCDNIAFPKKDGWKVPHDTTMEDLGTYNQPITLAAPADAHGKGGPWPVGTLFYVPMVHKYFVLEDSCFECRQDYKKGKKHVDLYMGPNKVGGSNLIHCEEALTTTSTIIVNPSPGYPVEPQKIYTPGNCTSKHNFPVDVKPSSSSSSSSGTSSSTSSGGSSGGGSTSSSSSGSSSSGTSSGSDNGKLVLLSADGKTDPYQLIKNAFKTGPQTPECLHAGFGKHVQQEMDTYLKKPVFVFYIHAAIDGDTCARTDRQRNEILTWGESDRYLQGRNGDTVTHRWKFKLDQNFKPSTGFSHLHQLKPHRGNDSGPMILIDPRIRGSEVLEVMHIGPQGKRTIVATASLAPFKGAWVDVYEKITYSHQGSYSITLTPDQGNALTFSSTNIDMWRDGIDFVEPKWGIYRALVDGIRDENILYNDFCVSNEKDDCINAFK